MEIQIQNHRNLCSQFIIQVDVFAMSSEKAAVIFTIDIGEGQGNLLEVSCLPVSYITDESTVA